MKLRYNYALSYNDLITRHLSVRNHFNEDTGFV